MIRFGETLGLPAVRFTGPSDSRRVVFSCEARWQPVPGSELHLFIEHAAAVDGNRAFLSVSLNGGIVRSLRLDATNEASTEIVIPLPKEMLRRSNELAMSVEEPTAAGAPAWTLLGPQSYVKVAYETRSAVASLGALPLPLLDPQSYRPLSLAILEPVAPSPGTLEALGLVVAGLANRVAPRVVAIHSERSLLDKGDPIVVVGTPREQPSLRALLQGATYGVDEASETLTRGDGSVLDAAFGVVSLLEHGQRTALVVSAGRPDGVTRGARGLLSGRPLPQPTALFSAEVPARRTLPREWTGHAPPRARFSLADLGYKGELGLAPDVPVVIPIRMTPDAQPLGESSTVTLVLNVPPESAASADAVVTVKWNGAVLGRLPSVRLQKPVVAETIRVPTALVRAENALSIEVAGASLEARGTFATLSPSSELYVPRSYVARLPDLAVLRSSLFPLSMRADLSDLVVLVPDDLGEARVPVLSEVAAFLGRLAPSDRVAFQVRTPGTFRGDERSGSNVLVLDAGGRGSLVTPPALDWRLLPKGEVIRDWPMLQELGSPWSPDRFVLLLKASSANGLLRGIERLGDPSVLGALAGDTAFLGPEAPACYRVGVQRTIEEVAYPTLVEAWLQSHWLVLPLFVAAVSAVLFLALRRTLGHYKAVRVGAPTLPT
jgi:hypothetical protein